MSVELRFEREGRNGAVYSIANSDSERTYLNDYIDEVINHSNSQIPADGDGFNEFIARFFEVPDTVFAGIGFDVSGEFRHEFSTNILAFPGGDDDSRHRIYVIRLNSTTLIIAFGFYKFFSGSWQFTLADERNAVNMEDSEKIARRSLNNKMEVLKEIARRIQARIESNELIIDENRPGIWQRPGRRQATRVESFEITGVSIV